MPSIAERKRRRQQSAVLRQARIDLLAELDQLKEKACEKCKKYTCDCPTAVRMREIGQDLSILINERTDIEKPKKEVKKVAKKKTPEITEEAVNAMRDKGMTYAAIAKEFGVSAPTLANRRQNWELERVRKQHREGKNVVDPVEAKLTAQVGEAEVDENTTDLSLETTYEAEINDLKATLLEKDEFIQKQWNTIDKLTADRDELAKQNESSGSWQDEIREERKLLAILLEREAARIKKLVEVG